MNTPQQQGVATGIRVLSEQEKNEPKHFYLNRNPESPKLEPHQRLYFLLQGTAVDGEPWVSDFDVYVETTKDVEDVIFQFQNEGIWIEYLAEKTLNYLILSSRSNDKE